MRALEFFKETSIVFREHAKVFHLVFEVGDTLNTHTKSKTAIFFAVDATCFKNIGVNHATTKNFYPSGVLAE